MPLVVNGVIIPTNVANAISVNGANITSIYHNGVLMWQQSLINITGWSGNSYNGADGINTSGLSFRATNQGIIFGAWLPINSSTGIFTTGSSSANSAEYSISFETSGSSLRDSQSTNPWVVYNPITKTFSGNGGTITTLNGLVRYILGAWISLT